MYIWKLSKKYFGPFNITKRVSSVIVYIIHFYIQLIKLIPQDSSNNFKQIKKVWKYGCLILYLLRITPTKII
jgi:hypothetical protein